MSDLPKNITRSDLEKFLPNQRLVVAFEKLLKNVNSLLPSDIATLTTSIEESFNAAAEAQATATQAIDALSRIAAALETIAYAPQASAIIEPDNLAPPILIGTLGQQNSDNATITNGSISGKVTNNQTILLATSATLANGAAAAAGTLLNAPVAGNPTKWVAINDNGTTRYMPAW